MTAQALPAKIPLAIWALTFCAFGLGTTEFVLVGLLPTIASDLSIPISSTGLLVTLYALGVAIGGPVVTALTGKIEHKKLLLLTMGVFVIGNAIAFLAHSIVLLQVSRVITGTTHGVFFAYAVIIASNMAGSGKKATVISLVFAGLMISTVVGVPLGTYIGTHYGWKMTFLAVALWGFGGVVILWLTLAKQPQPTEALRLKDLPTVLKNGSVLVVLLANIFAYTGTFILLTYLLPVLETETKFSLEAINFILLIFGAGVALGNVVGGRISNRQPAKVLVYLFFFHAVMLFLLSLVLASKPVVIGALLLFGFFAYSNVPALQLLAVQLSERTFPGSGGIASALNVSAFNIGAASGSFIGGLVADGPLTLKATPWVGGIFVVVAAGLGMLNRKRNGW